MANEVKIYPALKNLFDERIGKSLKTSLNEDLSDSDTTATVTDGSALPGSFPYHIILRDLTYGSADEICKVTGKSTNDLTIVRGQCGTTAIGHWYGEVYLCEHETVLNEFLEAGDTTATVVDAAGTLLPDGDCPYFILLRDQQYTGVDDEIVKVTAVSGNNLTIVRGQIGTRDIGHWYGDIFLCDVDTWLLEWYDDSESDWVDDGGGSKPVYGAGAGALCLPDDVGDCQIRFTVQGIVSTYLGTLAGSKPRGALAYRAWNDITNELAEAKSGAADDMTLLTAAPAVGQCYYICGLHPFTKMLFNITTPGVKGNTNYALTVEYYDGAAYTAVAGVNDGTAEFQSSGIRAIVFTMPDDWAKSSEGPSGDTTQGFWARVRVSAVVDDQTGYTQPLAGQAWVNEIYTGFASAEVIAGHEYAATILGWKESGATLPETIPSVICFDIQRAAIAATTVDARVLIVNNSGETRKIHVEIKNGVGLTVTPDDGAPNYTSFAAFESKWVDGEFTMPDATQNWEYTVDYYSEEISDWIETHAVDPALDMPGEVAVTETIAAKRKIYISFMVYNWDNWLDASGDADYMDDAITEAVAILSESTMFDIVDTTIYSDYGAPTDPGTYMNPEEIDLDEIPSYHCVVVLWMYEYDLDGGYAGGNTGFGDYHFYTEMKLNSTGAADSTDDYDRARAQTIIHELMHSIGTRLDNNHLGYPVYAMCGAYADPPGCIDHDDLAWYSTHKDGYRVFYHQISADGYNIWPQKKSLAGTITPTGALSIKVKLGLAGTLNSAGALGRKIGIGLAGTITPSGTVGKNQILRLISLSGTLTPSGSLGRKICTSLAGTLTPSGNVNRKTSISLSGTLNSSGTLARKIYVSLAGTLGLSGTVTSIFRRFVNLSGTLMMSGTVGRKISKTLSSAITFVGTLTHFYRKSIETTVVLHSRSLTVIIGGE